MLVYVAEFVHKKGGRWVFAADTATALLQSMSTLQQSVRTRGQQRSRVAKVTVKTDQ